MVSASRQSPGSHARSDVPRVAIHSLSHIHALRKLNPRFAQAIHGLSAQSAIHGLRKTIHGWSRSTVCAEHICVCVCVSAKNTAVCCLTAQKSPRNSSLPLGVAIYILRKMPRKPEESSVECYGHGFLIAARPRGV